MIDFDRFKELIATGETVCIKVKGNSMMPFLKSDTDTVAAVKSDGRFKVGDVVFYTRKNGAVVMHRIVKKQNDLFWMCGDAQLSVEGPINENQIFAKVTYIIHDGKKYDEDSSYFRFYSKCRVHLMKVWRFLSKH